jgi:hypothetical protein
MRESKPKRNRSVSPCLILGESNSQKGARSRAESAIWLDLFYSAAAWPPPSPDFAFSQHRERVPHRMDLVGETEAGGVHIPQQAITQRSFSFDGILDLPRIEFGP